MVRPARRASLTALRPAMIPAPRGSGASAAVVLLFFHMAMRPLSRALEISQRPRVQRLFSSAAPGFGDISGAIVSYISKISNKNAAPKKDENPGFFPPG